MIRKECFYRNILFQSIHRISLSGVTLFCPVYHPFLYAKSRKRQRSHGNLRTFRNISTAAYLNRLSPVHLITDTDTSIRTCFCIYLYAILAQAIDAPVQYKGIVFRQFLYIFASFIQRYKNRVFSRFICTKRFAAQCVVRDLIRSRQTLHKNFSLFLCIYMGERTVQFLCPHFPAVGQAALHICRCNGERPSGHFNHGRYLHLIFRILCSNLIGSHRIWRKPISRNAGFSGVHRDIVFHHSIRHMDILFQYAVGIQHSWREIHRFPIGHGTAADKELLFRLRPFHDKGH